MNRLNRVRTKVVAHLSFGHLGLLLFTVVAGSGMTSLLAQRSSAQERSPLLVYEVHPDSTDVPLDGKLRCTAKLTNLDDKAVTVYWGDGAWPSMYRFDIRNEASGEALPATRLFSPWPPRVPRSAEPKRFMTIPPGATANYQMVLTSSPGSNYQQVFFRRPGAYLVAPSLHVTTDYALNRETGELSLVPEAWTGELHAPPFTITVLGDDDVVEEGIEVSGRVISPDGRNLVDAHVVVAQRIPSAGAFDGFSEEHVDQALTDENGRFEFLRLPAESSLYRVTVNYVDYPTSEADIVNDGKNREYATTIVLLHGETITGNVVDEDNLPVAEVRVSCGGRSDSTDRAGQFTLTGVPVADEYYLDLWRPGYLRPTMRVPREQAARGLWKITLLPESATTLAGAARFPDGTPVANSKIEFHLTPTDPTAPEPRLRVEHVETDEAGGFALVLPEAREYSAMVKAFDPPPGGEPRDHNIGRVWKTIVGKVAPKSGPLEVVFENRCRLRVDLERTFELPKSLEWVVQCYRTDENRQVEEKRVGGETESVVFDRLGPGEYFVRVSIASAEQLNWQATIMVTTDAIETPAALSIEIPDVRFGSITARFLLPDGQTPFRNGRVSIDPSGGGRAPTTGDEGWLTLRDLPAGRVWLTPSADDIARTPIEGEVVADEVTNLGVIELQSVAEEFGEVFGTITYEDGTPVLGAVCTSGKGVAMESRHFALGTPVDADGGYHIRLPIGIQKLSFDLSGAAGWPNPGHPPPGAPRERFRKLLDHALSEVEVQAGQRVEHHIVLRRGSARRVKVRWRLQEGDANAMLGAMIQQPDVRISRLTFGASTDGGVELADLPPGECTLVLRSNSGNSSRRSSLAYFAAKTLDEDAEEVVFDASDAGELEFRVVGPNGEPVLGLGHYLSTEVAGHEINAYVASAAGATTGERTEPLPAHVTERDDGTLVVSALGPGSYKLRVTSPTGWTLETAVEIAERQTTTVEWQVDAEGHPTEAPVKMP